VMIGSRKFRFYANLTFDLEKLEREIKEDYEMAIERATYSNTSYEERQ
jgi:hypothetical protein